MSHSPIEEGEIRDFIIDELENFALISCTEDNYESVSMDIESDHEHTIVQRRNSGLDSADQLRQELLRQLKRGKTKPKNTVKNSLQNTDKIVQSMVVFNDFVHNTQIKEDAIRIDNDMNFLRKNLVNAKAKYADLVKRKKRLLESLSKADEAMEIQQEQIYVIIEKISDLLKEANSNQLKKAENLTLNDSEGRMSKDSSDTASIVEGPLVSAAMEINESRPNSALKIVSDLAGQSKNRRKRRKKSSGGFVNNLTAKAPKILTDSLSANNLRTAYPHLSISTQTSTESTEKSSNDPEDELYKTLIQTLKKKRAKNKTDDSNSGSSQPTSVLLTEKLISVSSKNSNLSTSTVSACNQKLSISEPLKDSENLKFLEKRVSILKKSSSNTNSTTKNPLVPILKKTPANKPAAPPKTAKAAPEKAAKITSEECAKFVQEKLLKTAPEKVIKKTLEKAAKASPEKPSKTNVEKPVKVNKEKPLKASLEKPPKANSEKLLKANSEMLSKTSLEKTSSEKSAKNSPEKAASIENLLFSQKVVEELSNPLLNLSAYKFNRYFPFHLIKHPFLSNKIDPEVPFCPYQLHGRCADEKCPWQHDFNYRCTDEDIIVRYLEDFPHLCPIGLKIDDYARKLLKTHTVEHICKFLVHQITDFKERSLIKVAENHENGHVEIT